MNEELIIKEIEGKQLRRLPVWSWYINGARMMLLRLREEQLTIEEHIVAAKGKRTDRLIITSEMKVLNKAFLDLILSDKMNVDRFLLGGNTIGFTDHERNKRGKLIKCRAFFARKVTKYEEIK